MLFRQRSKSALREGAARKESFEFSLPLLARSPRFALFSSSSCGGPVATHKGNSIPLLISPRPPFKREASAAAVVCLLWRLFPPRVRGWRKTAVFVYWGGEEKEKVGVCGVRDDAPQCCVSPVCVPPCPPPLPSFCVPCGRRRRLVAGNGGGGGGGGGGRLRLSRLLLWRKSLPPPSPEGVRRRELLHSFFPSVIS